MVGNMKDIEKIIVTHPSSKNASMKALVGEKEGWDNYVMRVVEVEPGGFTPKHSHPWPHINYFIEGEGEVMINNEFHKVTSGSYSFVPNDTLHQFINKSDTTFKFICIVPKEGHKV